jgi:small subunit ribosomal protein S21|tara:strand:+ start:9 stop:203 length:195 start_codon:yes stop_codon:yes gene_type:complete
MIIIKLDKNISIEKALRLYKSKLIKIKQNNELISRKKFEKKSVIKRKQILKAKYIQKLKTSNEI